MDSQKATAARVDDIAGQLEAAFNAGDAAALASLYSDSAVLMPPNEPMVKGRAGIQAWFERALPRVGRVSIAPVESTAIGDRGFQIGTFTTRPTSDAALAGTYVLLLTQRAGAWQIEYDIWSLDQPA